MQKHKLIQKTVSLLLALIMSVTLLIAPVSAVEDDASALDEGVNIRVFSQYTLEAEGIGSLDYGTLSPGDSVEFRSDYKYFFVQVNSTMGETLIYSDTGVFTFQVPKATDCYAPNVFSNSNQIKARVATEEELKEKRNLAVNAYDFRFADEETDYFAATEDLINDSASVKAGDIQGYPHAYANRVTENKTIFAARNAIDGVTNTANNHSNYPYQSWGCGKNDDAEFVVYFGREVTLDSLAFVLRADFGGTPEHDTYWEAITVEFSDGSEQTISGLQKGGAKQEFDIDSVTTTSIRLKNMKRFDNPNSAMWAALIEVEAYGTEATEGNPEAEKNYVVPDFGGQEVVVTTDKYSAADIAATIESVVDYSLANIGVNDDNWEEGVFFAGLSDAYMTTGDLDYYMYCRGTAENFGYLAYGGQPTENGDHYCIGQMYLAMNELSPDERKVANIQACADYNLNRGEVDYHWCDAIFMSAMVYRALTNLTGDESYVTTEHESYLRWRAQLYNEDYHLWYRDLGFVKPTTTTGKPIFWSRGNAWVFASLARQLSHITTETELLMGNLTEGDDKLTVSDILALKTLIMTGTAASANPAADMNADTKLTVTDILLLKDDIMSGNKTVSVTKAADTEDPIYQTLLTDFKDMAVALKDLQREDGTWNACVNDPEYYGGPETTGTAGFLYGFVTGVELGILDAEEYLPVALDAYDALTGFCMEDTGVDGKIGYMQAVAGSPENYGSAETSRNSTTDYGVGLFLLGASALMRMCDDYEVPNLEVPLDLQDRSFFRFTVEPGYYTGPITASASAEQIYDGTTLVNNLASGLFDYDVTGAVGKRWSALGRSQWAMADLGKEVALNKVCLYTVEGRDYLYKIEVSDNGYRWVTVVDHTTKNPGGAYFSDSFEPIYARYVRLVVNGAETYTGEWVNISELLLYEYTGTDSIRDIDDIYEDPYEGIEFVDGVSKSYTTDIPNEGYYQGSVVVTATEEQYEDTGTVVNNLATCLFDGVWNGAAIGNRWSASGYPNSVTADFEDVLSIDHITLMVFDGRQYYYQLEVSTDGENWETVVIVDEPYTTGENHTYTFENPIDARYVRLTVTGANSQSYAGEWISIKEMLLYLADSAE